MAKADTFDFAAVAAEDISVSDMREARASAPKVLSTPFVDWLRESDADGSAKRIVVPTEEAANQARAYVRQAAQYLNIGCRTSVAQTKDGYAVSFRAAQKRRYVNDADVDPQA